MKKYDLEKKESIEMFKGRRMLAFTTIHVIFTIVLFVAMMHLQLRMSSHIAQQKEENEDLRKIINEYIMKSATENEEGEDKNNDMDEQEQNIFQYKAGESKEKDEFGEDREEENEVDRIPLILRNKRNAKTNCTCGKGQRGKKGQKGSRGKRGRLGSPGLRGDPGIIGAKGDKGDRGQTGIHGIPGIPGHSGSPGQLGSPGKHGDKGSKGDKGGLESMFSQSAHIVGYGGEQYPKYIIGKVAYLLKSWKVSAGHVKGQMTYSNGYLNVGQKGFYYIYCQLYSKQRASAIYNFSLYIGNKEVIRVVKSIISSTRRYDTNYVGGVFEIQAGQKISVRTQYKNLFMYSSTESFFGAFMVHP